MGHKSSLRLTEQSVVRALRDRPGQSRTELSETTGIPRAALASAVLALVQRGVVLERGGPEESNRSVGRPATRLTLAGPERPALVIAFAHSSTAIAACDFDGDVIDRRQVAVTYRDARNQVLDAISAAGREILPGGASYGVISVPLPFQRGRGVQVREIPSGLFYSEVESISLPDWLVGDPSEPFADSLGIPVITENDANLAALGEAVCGAGRGRHLVIYLLLKDGIGAGIVADGQLFRGATGIAGEVAHVNAREDGRLCLCGNRGCLATLYGNGPKLADEVATLYGRPMTLEDLQHLAARSDVGIVRILTEVGRMIGKPIADLAVLVNPDAIIVDGSLGAAAEPIAAGIRELLGRRTPSMIGDHIIVTSGELGEDAVNRGAVELARRARVDRLLNNSR